MASIRHWSVLCLPCGPFWEVLKTFIRLLLYQILCRVFCVHHLMTTGMRQMLSLRCADNSCWGPHSWGQESHTQDGSWQSGLIKIPVAEVSTGALYALVFNPQIIGVPWLITSIWRLEYSFLSFLWPVSSNSLCITALLYLSILRNTPLTYLKGHYSAVVSNSTTEFWLLVLLIPAPLVSCVTLRKLPNLSVSWLPPL